MVLKGRSDEIRGALRMPDLMVGFSEKAALTVNRPHVEA